MVSFASSKTSTSDRKPRWYRSLSKPCVCIPFMHLAKNYRLQWDDDNKTYAGVEDEKVYSHFVIPVFEGSTKQYTLMIIHAKNDLQEFFQSYKKNKPYAFMYDITKQLQISPGKKDNINVPAPKDVEAMFAAIPALEDF